MEILYTKYVNKTTIMDIYYVVDADGDIVSYWSTKAEAEKALEEGYKIVCKKTEVRPTNSLR